MVGDKAFSSTFNEVDLMKKYPNLKPYWSGEHGVGSKSHQTEMYKFYFDENLTGYWSICPECKVVRTKKVIEYVLDDGEGYSVAFVNDIIKNGERV